MSPQRYEAVNGHDADEPESPVTPFSTTPTPSSPPPSFRSRTSSPASRRLLGQDPLADEAEQTLADAFDDGEGSDADDAGDDRQRLMRADPQSTTDVENQTPSVREATRSPHIQRRVTELPSFTPPITRVQNRGANRPTNDGVFANLAAKPERGQVLDEKPPVSQYVWSRVFRYADMSSRPTNKQPPTPLRLIGRQPSLRPAWAPTKFMWTVFPLDPSSRLYGMA